MYLNRRLPYLLNFSRVAVILQYRHVHIITTTASAHQIRSSQLISSHLITLLFTSQSLVTTPYIALSHHLMHTCHMPLPPIPFPSLPSQFHVLHLRLHLHPHYPLHPILFPSPLLHPQKRRRTKYEIYAQGRSLRGDTQLREKRHFLYRRRRAKQRGDE
ncbi:hypothetical protein K491DRAFT_384705 [Lophiostoma macrostomum CBS 122681]|uniref:Uncharacterized protein n=1 Tax=Lophiostoma macrostomum CBS 122681 TaxID=1314788 RepID=A0A6A6TRF4_9PLEO|nr:hypothetical protein K491DRAFT_384705 [Lophiostoma macrostomum CBS 122681]